MAKLHKDGCVTIDNVTVIGTWFQDKFGGYSFRDIEKKKVTCWGAAKADLRRQIDRYLMSASDEDRCAECDCANGGADCNWIKTTSHKLEGRTCRPSKTGVGDVQLP